MPAVSPDTPPAGPSGSPAAGQAARILRAALWLAGATVAGLAAGAVARPAIGVALAPVPALGLPRAQPAAHGRRPAARRGRAARLRLLRHGHRPFKNIALVAAVAGSLQGPTAALPALLAFAFELGYFVWLARATPAPR